MIVGIIGMESGVWDFGAMLVLWPRFVWNKADLGSGGCFYGITGKGSGFRSEGF